jgi:hypothetical protein
MGIHLNGQISVWNYHFEDGLSQKRTHFRENFMGNENFRETKFALFRIIFAFCENGKNRFRFNPSWKVFNVYNKKIYIDNERSCHRFRPRRWNFVCMVTVTITYRYRTVRASLSYKRKGYFSLFCYTGAAC